MNTQLFWLFVFLAVLFLLIIATEFLYRRLKFKAEQSRKFLHLTGGISCLFLPLVFKSHWWLLVLASVTFIVLYITYKKRVLASVHQVQRKSVGSILFPVPVYAGFLFAELQQNFLLYYIPVSLLTISDTAAEIGGNHWGAYSKKFFAGQKTLAGTICFLSTSIIICYAWLISTTHLPSGKINTISITTALASTITELFTLKGWDNLTVPLISMIVIYSLL